MTTPRHGYSSLQIALHWTVVVLVAVQWFLGQGMERVFDAVLGGQDIQSMGPAYVHVVLGVTVLLVMLGRLLVRLNRPVQTAPDSPHRLLALLGRINHWAFYAMLIVIPLTGAVAWFGRVEASGDLHSLLVTILLVLIAIHAGAALFHHFVLRDGLIRRMIRPA